MDKKMVITYNAISAVISLIYLQPCHCKWHHWTFINNTKFKLLNHFLSNFLSKKKKKKRFNFVDSFDEARNENCENITTQRIKSVVIGRELNS